MTRCSDLKNGDGLLLSHQPCQFIPIARPLRADSVSDFYHITSRGDGREDIYLSDADGEGWLLV